MKYVLLIYQPSPFDPKSLTAAVRESIGAGYAAVTATANVVPGLPFGVPQQATTVRVRGDEVRANDGPFVNAAGAVGGHLVFDAETKEEAIALAARVPAARLGGAVEVRPAEAYW